MIQCNIHNQYVRVMCYHIYTQSAFSLNLYSSLAIWNMNININMQTDRKYWLNSKRDFLRRGAGDILFRNYPLWGMDLKGRKNPYWIIIIKIEIDRFVERQPICINQNSIRFDSIRFGISFDLFPNEMWKWKIHQNVKHFTSTEDMKLPAWNTIFVCLSKE